MARQEPQVFEREHGVSIPYLDEGDGPPIVLLPGGSLDISYLARLAAALTAGGMRVVRVGARTPPTDPDVTVSMHDLAADVLATMKHLDLPKAWIAGHAFGNRVARTVALDQPDRIAGVVLLAAGGTVQPSPEAADALRIAFSDVSHDEAVSAMRYFVGDPADAESAWDAIDEASTPVLGAMQRQAVMTTPQQEWASLVPGMDVLIIQGSKDQIAPPANGEELARSAPDQVTL
ncbi:MAG: alpha/beta fold hydrolase, partial [Desertimonas sp.]